MKKILLPLLMAVLLCGALEARKTPASRGKQAKTTIQVSENKTPATSSQSQGAEANEGKTVDIVTSLGTIKVKLYDDTPLHRDNFLKLAREGYYDGVLFHRVIKDFMVQTGDPDSKTAAPGAMLGAGSPDYTIPAEILYPRHWHKYGALAAARTGDQVNPERRSSGSQFYIVTGRKISPAQMRQIEARMGDTQVQEAFRALVKENAATIDSLRKSGMRDEMEALRQELIAQAQQSVKVEPLPQQMVDDYTTIGGAPHLDGQYTVFGEVTEGMDIVEKIQNSPTARGDRPVEDIKVLKVIVEEN